MANKNPPPKRETDHEDGEPMWLIILVSVIASVLTVCYLKYVGFA